MYPRKFTTRTIVAKTAVRVDVNACRDYLLNHVSCRKYDGAIMQVRCTFKNSVGCSIFFNDSYFNLKLCRNGTFHSVGKISPEVMQKCIEEILRLLHSGGLAPDPSGILVNMYVVMTNYVYSFPGQLNADRLVAMLNSTASFIAYRSPGSKPVNCKYRIEERDVHERYVDVVRLGEGVVKSVPFSDISKSRPKKNAFVTFIVFSSGKIIVSGMDERILEASYALFVDAISKCVDDGGGCRVADVKTCSKKRTNYKHVTLVRTGDGKYVFVRGQPHYTACKIRQLSAPVVCEWRDISAERFSSIRKTASSLPGVTCVNITVSRSCATDEATLVGAIRDA